MPCHPHPVPNHPSYERRVVELQRTAPATAHPILLRARLECRGGKWKKVVGKRLHQEALAYPTNQPPLRVWAEELSEQQATCGGLCVRAVFDEDLHGTDTDTNPIR